MEQVDSMLAELGYSEAVSVCPNIEYSCTIDSTRSTSADTWKEFLRALTRFSTPEKISIHSHWTAESRPDLEIRITYSKNQVHIIVGSTDEAINEFVHSRLQECFSASNPAPEKSPGLSRWNLKKTVFLAHRFDDQGKRVARTLERFLNRSGFRVIEGEGYEARQIPAKVTERIEEQDIMIALLTPGDHTWITSEAAFAHAHRKYVIFIAQEGLQVQKGIMGSDYEHLIFPPDLIEKIFIDLLYALPS
jgi:predicted nucleotide-binding protein